MVLNRDLLVKKALNLPSRFENGKKTNQLYWKNHFSDIQTKIFQLSKPVEVRKYVYYVTKNVKEQSNHLKEHENR